MKAISVRRQVKIEGAWKMLPLARKDDKLDWKHLVHNGKLVPIAATSGTFYLDWYEGTKRKRPAVGETVSPEAAILLKGGDGGEQLVGESFVSKAQLAH